MNSHSGAVSRSREPSLSASLDATLEATGYTKADAIWHRATDALLARDYTAFDALMHEFRATTKHWKSPTEHRVSPISGGER